MPTILSGLYNHIIIPFLGLFCTILCYCR